MKRFLRWRRGHDVGPRPTEEELLRADQWMRNAFLRDTKRIADQTPRDLLERCVNVAHDDEGRVNSSAWLSHQAWGWAAVIVLVALAAAVIMRSGRPDDTASSQSAVIPSQPAPGQPPLLARPHHSPSAPPLRGRALSPGQVTQDESPPVIARRAHTIDSTRRTNAIAQRNASRLDGNARSHSANEERDGEPTTPLSQGGGSVAEWELESPNPGFTARGSAQISGGGVAPGSVASVTTVASNLVPNATYTVLIQFAGSTEPVVVDRGRTDASGALHFSVELTAERVEAIRQEIAINTPRETDSGNDSALVTGAGMGTNRDSTGSASISTGGGSGSTAMSIGTLILPNVVGVMVRSDTGETALQPSTGLRPH